MTRGASRRRILAFGGLWVAVSCAVLVAPGCYGRNCDPSVETYGDQPGEGRMIDEDTWESSAVDGTWLWYPRQRFYSLTLPLNGRTPQVVIPYLSARPEPNKTGADSTIGGGNLALIHNVRPNGVDIRNDTCSDYFLRVVVIAGPLPPDADAAAPEDGGPTDADASDAGDDGVDDAGDAQVGP